MEVNIETIEFNLSFISWCEVEKSKFEQTQGEREQVFHYEFLQSGSCFFCVEVCVEQNLSHKWWDHDMNGLTEKISSAINSWCQGRFLTTSVGTSSLKSYSDTLS